MKKKQYLLQGSSPETGSFTVVVFIFLKEDTISKLINFNEINFVDFTENVEKIDSVHCFG